MGKLVNVVLPGGKVVSVPEELAEQTKAGGTSHLQTLEESTGTATSVLNDERSSGIGEGFKSALEGFGDAASLGLLGKGLSYGDENYARNLQIRAHERPGARLAGELTSLLLPTGALGDAAAGVGKLLPGNIVAGAAGRAGGLLAEGAVYGAGGAIANSNVTGDPLTIEGVVVDAGVGALLNYGIGKIADKVTSGSKSVQAKIAKEAEGEAAENFFQSSPESYNELRQAHQATNEATKIAQKKYDKVVGAYQEELGNFSKDIPAIKKAIYDIDVLERQALAQIKYGKVKSDGVIKPAQGGDYTKLTEAQVNEIKHVRDILSESRTRANAHIKASAPDLAVKELDEAIGKARLIVPEAEFPVVPHLDDAFNIPRPKDIGIEKLPKTIREFANLDPKTIEKLANSVEPDSVLGLAIQKFTEDVGMRGGVTAASTLADVHAGMQNMLRATASVEGKSASNNILSAIKNHAKRGVQYGFGRIADQTAGRGFAGAIARTAVGGGVGYALDGTEGAIIGATLLSGKTGARSKLETIFAKYGEAAGRGISKLGPVTAVLSQTFPGGETDTEKDTRKLAANRVRELQSLSQVVNDLSFSAVQDIQDQPDDIAFKIHQQMVATVQNIAMTAPRDAGIAMNMGKSFWKPTATEAAKFASTMEAALSPMTALNRLISGGGTQESADMLWKNYPAHMQEAATQLAAHVAEYKDLTREQSSRLSRIFRVPLNGFAQPETIATLQSMFLPKGEGGTESTPPSKQPTGGPTGRPPKVNAPNPGQTRTGQLTRSEMLGYLS